MVKSLSSLPVGAKIKDTNTKYNGAVITWLVGGHNHYGAGQTVLVSERIITLKSFDAMEPSSTDSNRQANGNNRYARSNIRQWLNSNANAWYAARHSADAPPNNTNGWANINEYDQEPGFLTNFSEKMRNVLVPTKLTVAKNTVTDDGGSEVVGDTVFLLSNTEVGLANENNIAEGKLLAMFSDDASRIAYPTTEAVSKSEYTSASLKSTSPWYYWLRSPNTSTSHSARSVYLIGALGYSGANSGSHGVRPALNLPSEILVSDTTDADGAYILFNTSPTVTTIPTQTTTFGINKTVTLSTYFSDADGDTLTYKATSNRTTVGTTSISGGVLTLTPKSVGTASITVTATDTSGETASTIFTFYVRNSVPTATLSQPTDASTLYENTAYTISGNATDVDNGSIVNVRYSINDGTSRALATGISDGNTAISFTKTLTFKNGKLFDGATAITDSLADGTAHMLRVWATDDQGVTSTIISRSFYAVPNRAPSLTVDTPQPSGTINSDKFAITGTCSDIDGNEVTVAYRINGANPVQIYKGQGGAWSFDISLSTLQVGANSIVIEVADSYNFKATKTVRLNKNEIKRPVNTATARYKLTPPKGSATGVLLWVRRTETLQLDAKISMVLAGEQEQYFAPTDAVTTAQVSQGIVEDEFIFETAEAKTDIVLKLEMTKTQENDAITLITGGFN